MDTAREPRTLGDAIRRRRLELGWTQEDLAARVADLGGDLRQSDVSRIERGKVGLPRRERLDRIAAALDLPLGELLSRSGWAGAEDAFDRLAEPPATETPSLQRAELAETEPTPAELPAPLSPRLHAAIDESHVLREWSSDVLRRAATTLERASRSLGRNASTPPRP